MAGSACSHDRLLRLIERLYAAPGSPDAWVPFLDELCDAAGGYCAQFLSVDQHGHAGVALTVRSDPAARAAYDGHWGAYDPWGNSATFQRAASGSVLFGEEMIPHAELRRTAYYADFARPNDLVRCLAGMIEAAPDAFSVVSIGRTETHKPFGTEEGALLNALMPHLRQALRLHRRIAALEAASDDLADVLDRVSRAVILVDTRGNVTWTNHAANGLLAARDGLIVDNGQLRAARGSDTTRLRTLVADAAATAAGQGLGVGGALQLGRPSGRRPLMAVVASLVRRSDFFSAAAPPVVAVIVTDPESARAPDEETLRELLGLTPAEAALTRLLAQGLTLGQAAARLGLRTETLRTRLKTIFEKTGTHRQADLVRLALLGVGQV